MLFVTLLQINLQLNYTIKILGIIIDETVKEVVLSTDDGTQTTQTPTRKRSQTNIIGNIL